MKMYTQKFEHWTRSSTTDDWNNPIEGWVKDGDINCRLRPLSGDRVIRDEARNVIADVKFYMSADEDISAGDQLRSDNDYEVTAVINPMSMDRFLQVEARLL